MNDDLPPITAKLLALERYDGTTDPDDHIDAFLTQINLLATNDATLCRVFPITLKGAASSWFRSLPEHSIDSFDTSLNALTLSMPLVAPIRSPLPHLPIFDRERMRHFVIS